MGIAEVVTAPRSPWQNAYVERVIGSIRRECLDHIVIFNERHLRRVLPSYVDYYHRTRTHLSLDKDCPDPRPVMPPGIGESSPSRKSVACITATNGSLPDSFNFLFANVAPRLFRVVRGSRYKSLAISTVRPKIAFALDRSPDLLLASIQHQFMQLFKFRLRWNFW